MYVNCSPHMVIFFTRITSDDVVESSSKWQGMPIPMRTVNIKKNWNQDFGKKTRPEVWFGFRPKMIDKESRRAYWTLFMKTVLHFGLLLYSNVRISCRRVFLTSHAPEIKARVARSQLQSVHQLHQSLHLGQIAHPFPPPGYRLTPSHRQPQGRNFPFDIKLFLWLPMYALSSPVVQGAGNGSNQVHRPKDD